MTRVTTLHDEPTLLRGFPKLARLFSDCWWDTDDSGHCTVLIDN